MFESHFVGNTEDRFCRGEAHILEGKCKYFLYVSSKSPVSGALIFEII